MKLTYVKGNLFDHLKDKTNIIVCHVANTAGVFGAGFAATVRKLYPDTNDEYEHYCEERQLSNSLYYTPSTLLTYEPFGYFANMICQTGLSGSSQRNATYSDLVDCMQQAIEDIPEGYEIYAPKFGAGLCGMNWDFIEELIKDIWIPVTNVTIFEL